MFTVFFPPPALSLLPSSSNNEDILLASLKGRAALLVHARQCLQDMQEATKPSYIVIVQQSPQLTDLQTLQMWDSSMLTAAPSQPPSAAKKQPSLEI